MLNVEEVARGHVCISVNGYSVPGLEAHGSHKIMRVRFIRPSTTARIRLKFCFPRLSVMDQAESLTFDGEERQPSFED